MTTIYDAAKDAEMAMFNARVRVDRFATFVTREFRAADLDLPAEVMPGMKRDPNSLQWAHMNEGKTPAQCRSYMEALRGLLIQARASGAIERFDAERAEYDAIVIPEDV